MATLPQVAHPAQEGPRRGVGEMIREGWRYVVRHPVIGPCAADATAVNFVCGGLMALTPVFLAGTLDAPPALVGALIATEGLGTLVGAALTPRIVARLGSGRALRRAAVAAPCFAALLAAGRTLGGTRSLRPGQRRLRRVRGGDEHRDPDLPADRHTP
ncbi:MFS transporter [Streptomyces sp. NPDC006743]|uniref:MFS transporter n=1 Tax=Streptomyces sp. NPDC006743 TaxID=3154480 RepID=UPI0034532364